MIIDITKRLTLHIDRVASANPKISFHRNIILGFKTRIIMLVLFGRKFSLCYSVFLKPKKEMPVWCESNTDCKHKTCKYAANYSCRFDERNFNIKNVFYD